MNIANGRQAAQIASDASYDDLANQIPALFTGPLSSRLEPDCPVRSDDFGLVLFALRSAPSDRFCLTGLSRYIWDFLLLFLLFYRCIYISTLFNSIVSLVELE